MAGTCKIIFVGSTPPRAFKKILHVRREVVRLALAWLCRNNPLYFNIIIDNEVLNSYPVDAIPNSLWDTKIQTDAADQALDENASYTNNEPSAINEKPIINCTGFVDVEDISTTPEKLRDRALDTLVTPVPHLDKLANDFDGDVLMGAYPWLFPYGRGAWKKDNNGISRESLIKHWMNFHDPRFRQDYTFPFTVFNIIQKHQSCKHVYMKLCGDTRLSSIANINASTLSEALKLQQTKTKSNKPEINKLMQCLQVVGAEVIGSKFSLLNRRNELRANQDYFGMPTFFMTLNFNDINSAIVLALGDKQFSEEMLLSGGKWSSSACRSKFVADNPHAAATAFHKIMGVILDKLLKWKDSEPGVLGKIEWLSGFLEEQGRGTLHMHALLRIQGIHFVIPTNEPQYDSNFIILTLCNH